MIRAFVFVLLSAAGCSQAKTATDIDGESGGFATVLEAPPYPPIQRLGPEPYKPSLADKRWRFASGV